MSTTVRWFPRGDLCRLEAPFFLVTADLLRVRERAVTVAVSPLCHVARDPASNWGRVNTSHESAEKSRESLNSWTDPRTQMNAPVCGVGLRPNPTHVREAPRSDSTCTRVMGRPEFVVICFTAETMPTRVRFSSPS